jgi:hypothetical protein
VERSGPDQGFYRTGDRWKYQGPTVLKDWQVHLHVNGKRVVCENPSVWDTEVISCDEILVIDDGDVEEESPPEGEPPPPLQRKTAYEGAIFFVPDPEPAYRKELRDRLEEIDEGLRGPHP